MIPIWQWRQLFVRPFQVTPSNRVGRPDYNQTTAKRCSMRQLGRLSKECLWKRWHRAWMAAWWNTTERWAISIEVATARLTQSSRMTSKGRSNCSKSGLWCSCPSFLNKSSTSLAWTQRTVISKGSGSLMLLSCPASRRTFRREILVPSPHPSALKAASLPAGVAMPGKSSWSGCKTIRRRHAYRIT